MKKYLTKKQLKKIRIMWKEACKVPVVAFTSADAIAGNTMDAVARKIVFDAINKLAVSKGLPEGNYKLNLKTGELI